MRRQARISLQFGPESERPRRPSDVEENPRDTDTLIAAHLNPTTPFVSPSEEELLPSTALRSILVNLVALLAVCVAGVLGWWISPPTDEGNTPSTEMNTLGQVFGYLCAVLYLASRVPQIILNAKRKSCDGVSLLFFLFACLGNTTFLASIFTYMPGENEGTYADYLKVNSSWIIGSAGTLALDLVVCFLRPA
jgi:solute carrier family 66 (lysosomal lysine-arginine transporter), member 1